MSPSANPLSPSANPLASTVAVSPASHPTPVAVPRYSRKRVGRHARGFTLVELLVAMTAGLIVAGAVVSLSKTATTTFQEESRATSAEMSLRIASERLRNDLARASYMSSPNVRIDNSLARPKGVATNTVGLAFQNGLGALAGVRYEANGSVSGALTNSGVVNQYSLANNLNPDSIVLGGNFTAADEYIVQTLLPDTAGCGGTAARLSLDSSAVLRLTHSVTGALKPIAEIEQALRDVFVPVPVGVPGAFMARVVDESGKSQLVGLCANAPPTFEPSGTAGVAVIHLDTTATTPLLTSLETGARGGASGFSVGRATINPVQLVRWSLRRRVDATLDAPTGSPANLVDSRFELTRTWLNIDGSEIANGSELIADYVVDLEFAFSVDDPTAGANRQVSFQFNQPDNDAWGKLTTLAMTTATRERPDRIRSVRFRMAARAAIADRDAELPYPTTGYLYRYCLKIGGCTSTDPQQYARVRTLVSEVSLPNQKELR